MDGVVAAVHSGEWSASIIVSASMKTYRGSMDGVGVAAVCAFVGWSAKLQLMVL